MNNNTNITIAGQLTEDQVKRLSSLEPVKITIDGVGTFLTHATQYSEYRRGDYSVVGSDAVHRYNTVTTISFADLEPVVNRNVNKKPAVRHDIRKPGSKNRSNAKTETRKPARTR